MSHTCCIFDVSRCFLFLYFEVHMNVSICLATLNFKYIEIYVVSMVLYFFEASSLFKKLNK